MTDNYISFEEFSKRVPEVFIQITDISIPNIKPYYTISNYGRVYNIQFNRFLGCHIANNGYHHVSLMLNDNSTYHVLLHRLVLVCFFPFVQPINSTLEVNHKNGNKSDNFINPYDINDGNLEWCTKKENMEHASKNGLFPIGENRYSASISNDTAQKVINLLAENKYSNKEIIDIINDPKLKSCIITSIKTRKSWTHLSGNLEYKMRTINFTEQEIHEFCNLFSILPSPGEYDLCINDLCRIALVILGYEPDDKYVETLRKVYTRKRYINITSQYLY